MDRLCRFMFVRLVIIHKKAVNIRCTYTLSKYHFIYFISLRKGFIMKVFRIVIDED